MFKKGEEMKKLTLLLVAITIVFSGALMSQNLIENSSFEEQVPAFWDGLNGAIGSELTWESTEVLSGFHSFKVSKSVSTTNMVGWVSVNNAN